MIWEIGTLAKQVLLPPLGLTWLLVAAWLLLRRRPALARTLIAATIIGWAIMATPITSGWLVDLVRVPAAEAQYGRAQAIVILGGGRRLIWDAQHENVKDAHANGFTLERLHAGARIARRTGLPVLVTSGKPDGFDPTEAEVMRRVLTDDYGIVPRWLEDESRNTAENADFSARMLLPQGIRTVILVTSGFHLRRAITLFAQAGVEALPAPAPPSGPPGPLDWRDFLPNAQSLMRSHYAVHEIGGLIYAAFRARPTPSATVGN